MRVGRKFILDTSRILIPTPVLEAGTLFEQVSTANEITPLAPDHFGRAYCRYALDRQL